jgi:Domain of unknown function (DUF4270)
MYTNSFFKTILFLALTITLGSCDKDFNTIGGDLVENNHFGLDSINYNVIAYTQKTGAVQTDNLTVNALGIYNDANFGETTASLGVQVLLEKEDVTIGTKPIVESVVLTIPYFVDASKTKQIKENDFTYELDSIYGTRKAKMKLSVYRSGFFINNLEVINTIVSDGKKHYSSQVDFEEKKKELLNLDGNTTFFFDETQRFVTTLTKDKDGKDETIKTSTVPGMELKLKTDDFQALLTSGKIKTNIDFIEYFNGLYFKIEKIDATGELALLNFKEGKITINYKEESATTTSSFVLNLKGNAVSLLKTENNATNSAYATLPNIRDKTANDPKLYLKGGEGAMAVLSLGDLQALKDSKAKVNEANLVFNIDTEAMATTTEPNRVYLYDLTNNLPIVDYSFDRSGISGFPKKGRSVYNGIIKRIATNGKGISYSVNITNHIRNIIQNGADNVKLGLVVTEDINNTDNNVWKYPIKLDPNFTNNIGIPISSIMNPLGTILFGSNIPSTDTKNYSKRLKLQIYYTKPN